MCSSMRHVSKKPNIKIVYENIDISRLIGIRGEIEQVVKVCSFYAWQIVWKYKIRYTRMTIYLTQVVQFPNSKSSEPLILQLCAYLQCWRRWRCPPRLIKGSRTGWKPMSCNWGQNSQSDSYLNWQSLSFQATTIDGRTIVLYNTAPSNWQSRKNFEGIQL